MSNQYPGGFILKNPIQPTTTTASGIWTVSQAAYWVKNGLWPTSGDPDPDFDYVSLLLPGNGTNGAQNNTFLDSSANNFTITRNGDTTQGSFSPYGDLWSNYFDGTGDYLSMPDNAALDLSGDFTIECWVMWIKRSGSAYPRVVSKGDYQLAAGAWNIVIDESNGNIIFDYGNPSVSISIGTLTAGVWAHIAVSRSGTTLRTFMNGSLTSTATVSQDFSSTYTVRVGAGTDARTNEIFAGYISNLRVVKGTAVYTAAFTPPTAPLTAITNTSLLTCQSNRFRDASTNNFAITRNGDVRVTNFAPFNPTAAYDPATNGGSGYFDGSGDYLTINGSTAVNFGTGDFTVELWVYTANSGTLLDGASGVQNAINIGIDAVTKQVIFFSSTTPRIYGDGFTPNAWQHIALTRSGTSTRLFLNGIQAGGTFTDSSSYVSGTNRPIIGNSTYVNSPLLGYISNLRVVKGTALYTSNFTPPTAPITAITNTSLLLNFTNAGIVDASAKNDLVTVGNAQISTAQSKFGGSSMAFDGSGDYLTYPAGLNTTFGTGDFTVEAWIYFTNANNTPFYFFDNRNASQTATWAFYRTSVNTIEWFNGSTSINSTATIAPNQWHHVAYTRLITTGRIFLNGTQIATGTDSTNYSVVSTIGYIGARYSASEFLNGYIDDLRITKGVARYTANFTPPTAPFLSK